MRFTILLSLLPLLVSAAPTLEPQAHQLGPAITAPHSNPAELALGDRIEFGHSYEKRAIKETFYVDLFDKNYMWVLTEDTTTGTSTWSHRLMLSVGGPSYSSAAPKSSSSAVASKSSSASKASSSASKSSASASPSKAVVVSLSASAGVSKSVSISAVKPSVSVSASKVAGVSVSVGVSISKSASSSAVKSSAASVSKPASSSSAKSSAASVSKPASSSAAKSSAASVSKPASSSAAKSSAASVSKPASSSAAKSSAASVSKPASSSVAKSSAASVSKPASSSAAKSSAASVSVSKPASSSASVSKPASSSKAPVSSSTAPKSSSSVKPPTSSTASSSAAAVSASASVGVSLGVSASDQAKFLTLHNDFRAKYSAGKVTWDDSLAAFALKTAQTCKYGHTGGPNGENIAAGVGGGYNIDKAFSSWANEDALYNFALPGYASGTGHFTQIVWKGTSKIGCAAATCADGTIFSGYRANSTYVVCEYQTPGNIVSSNADRTAELFRTNVGPKISVSISL